jgi:hypothetical protein
MEHSLQPSIIIINHYLSVKHEKIHPIIHQRSIIIHLI